MNEEDIAKVNEWFDRHTENYGTYRTDREYSLSDWDMQEFADFLHKEFPDLFIYWIAVAIYHIILHLRKEIE